MNIKLSLVSALSLVALTVAADPAPVADLSRSSGVQSTARSGSVTERLSELERVVDARAQAQLQMQQQLESLMTEVSELRGTTDEQSYKLEQILQQQRDIYQEIDRRLGGGTSSSTTQTAQPAQVPAGNPAAVVAADQVATADTAPEQQDATPAMSEDDAFKQVQALINEKKYVQAIKALNTYNKDFPESANLPRSYYMLGLLHQQNGAPKKAKASFEVVYKKFPNSDKAPLALFKLGVIAGEQNDAEGQKKYFNTLIKAYPKSKQAADARKALDKK
jgi:tol-pal system protein YbgF